MNCIFLKYLDIQCLKLPAGGIDYAPPNQVQVSVGGDAGGASVCAEGVVDLSIKIAILD